MKRFLIAAAVAAATVTTPAFAADVGVSVSIGEPGFYGRIDIGNFPRPQVIYRQPIIIERVPMERPPIYLRVPPGHAKHWRKHCREYNACGERVYFVQDSWYNREYVPRYQEQHRDRGDDRRDERSDDGRGKHKNDRNGKDHDRGRDH
ncbi:MAG: hypothetical protein HY937_00350 [Nitrosomonadales bacterium]|nr:hypothetical protein [Nitrosomonadales bacterium]